MKLLSNLDLQQNYLLNAALQQLATAPTSPVSGQFYFSTATKTIHYYNGTSDYDSGIAAHSISELTVPTAALAMAGFKITGMANGVSATDAATMANVTAAIDGIIASIAWKPIVRLVSVANIATLTAAMTTLDSVTVASGDRILLTAQTTASQNGVYVYTTGTGLTRAGDLAQNYELQEGSTWEVTEGATSGALNGQPSRWYVSTTGVITPGTTAVTIIQIGAGNGVYTAGLNVAVTGQVISVPFGTFPKKFAIAVGNGSSTSFTITHGLGLVAVNGAYPCSVQLFDSSGNLTGCDFQSSASNSLILSGFGTAPATNALTVVVTG